MTTSEAIDVFKGYLAAKIVPRPMKLIEASKIAIKVLTQQLEETDKQYHWKPSEEQMEALKECGECKRCIKELYEQLKGIYNNGKD